MSRLSAVRTALLSRRVLVSVVSARDKTTSSREDGILKSPLGGVKVPMMSLPQYIFKETGQLPDKPAVTCGVTGLTYTFSQVKELSQQLAWSLVSRLKLKKGQVIGLLLPNTPEFPIAIHGALAAGLVVTFANPLYTAGEIGRQFKDAGVRCCVTVPQLQGLTDAVAAMLPSYTSTIVVGQDKHQGTHLSFQQLLDEAQPTSLPTLDPRDLALLPYSSGTTGLPKGVMLNHLNLVSNLQMMKHPDIVDHQPTTDTYQEVSLTVLPFFHIYGFNSILNGNMVYGFQLVSLPRFTPEDYIACLEKYRPTMLFVVPSLLLFLATHSSVTRAHLESVKGVVSGAAPATRSLLDKFLDKVARPVRIRQGYGMTESAPVTLFPRREVPISKLCSVGQLMPLTEAKVVDKETGKLQGTRAEGELLVRGPQVSGKTTSGQLLPGTLAKVVDTETNYPVNGPYQLGELLLKGPQVMMGYLNNKEATRETVDEDGWLHTGDVVYYDEDEYFFIVDRTKELIKVKGNQVSPTELENIIMELPDVSDVAVVGIPDDKAGEIPRAFVVLRPNSKLTEGEIIEHVKPRVVKYKNLSGGVRFLDVIPRNPSGKILRQKLKTL
ncbi:uncharacterized protein [Anabrus simplex]|uniref:uncharacterized protein isoform X1 n=1 Tax=Anabrus simplex TaxID=316456 RepID=UPI0034DD07D8